MANKSSSTANSGGRTVGDPLDYQLDYEYAPGTHKAVRIGKRHYSYDLSGNLTSEQDGPFAQAPAAVSPEVFQTKDGAYYAEGAWGLIEPGSAGSGPGKNVYRRDYKWDERNRLAQSSDTRFNVRYKYTESGERTSKYATSATGGGGNETLYFGKLWSRRYQLLGDRSGHYSKHIFLGEARLASKVQSGDGAFVPNAEAAMTYYYHSDHLGSAQLITDYKGEEYERLEYTPYGELWIDKTPAISILDIPYRFTGKERDSETGLYYYGARYLDAKTARWLSTDPAMGDYVPGAPVNDEAKKRNGNLPGMGGVFNVVNLHTYHYAGNNPIKYTDPDGEDICHFGRYPGWSEDAPQARIRYKDWFDPASEALTFRIHGAKVDFGKGHLRLWKGDYNNLPAMFGKGGAGGEIGFYSYKGDMIKGGQLQRLKFGIGLEKSTMQLFAKNDKRLVAEYGELSGWVTAFNASESVSKENLYTVNTFEFKTEGHASRFGNALKKAVAEGAENYPHGGGEKLNVDIQGKKVILTFGLNDD